MPKQSENARLERTDALLRKALKPAEVALDVIEFKDVLANGGSVAKRRSFLKKVFYSPRGSTARMTVSKPHPRVRIDSKEPAILKVKAPGATIRFTVSPDEYYAIGISFLLLEGLSNPGVSAKLGLLDIEPCKIHRFGHVLYVTDTFKNRKPFAKYKFSIIIQRASDGALGIIDPGIEHDSTDS